VCRNTNDEGASGGFDNIIGDDGELVDFQNALDLHEQPVQRAEVPAGDAGDRGDGLSETAIAKNTAVPIPAIPSGCA
jgi:hypothetical protein